MGLFEIALENDTLEEVINPRLLLPKQTQTLWRDFVRPCDAPGIRLYLASR